MASLSDAVVVSDLITRALNLTQQPAWRLYKASTDRQVFQDRLTDLQNQSGRWTEDLRKYGMESDPEIRALLKQACLLLDQEAAKNKELQSSWFRRLGTTVVFPEALIDAMEKVCSAFERLPQRLADREAAKQLLEKAASNQRPILPFMPDNKYVEFKATIASVRSALESPTGGRIVTLYGGPGQGKTSMGRHLALQYQNGFIDENPPVHVPEEALSAPDNSIYRGHLHHAFFRCCDLFGNFVSLDESSDPNLPTNVGEQLLPAQDSVSRIFPDGVFFYRCGQAAKSVDILLRLWGDLGYELHPRTVEARQDGAGSSDKTQESSSTEGLIRELMRRLANQKVLIVLDDVWHHMLIEEVLVQGTWVKYLITTQKSQLWMDADCVNVRMANPTLEEARRILRNHVRGFPSDVTPEIEGTVDAIIEKSAYNPLVLANVAKYVRRPDDLEEWKSAEQNLEKPLYEKGVHLSSVLFGRTYSKPTMQASITMAVDSFSMQEQTLLFLASMCEGQSIPEVVFKMFFKKIHDSLYWFSRCSENLQSNNFMQIESKIVPWSKVPERSWSLHSMRQQVIDEIKDEEITSLVEKLLKSDTQDKIVVVLLVLYGQQRWRDQATDKLMNSAEQSKNNYLQSARSHFSTIKPFVWLLHGDGEEEWEKEADHLVEQVVHHYMVAGELDDDGLSTLLAMQQTVSSTTVALEKMATLKDEPIFTIRHPKTAHAFLNVLGRVIDKSMTTSAHKSAWLLSKFSFEGLEDTKSPIGLQSFPNVIESLSALLATEVPPKVQECASLALAYFSLPAVAYPINIASFPVTLQRLVALLGRYMRPSIQNNVAAALGNISSTGKENAIEIVSFPGAIQSLVALLSQHVTPNVQQSAAYALGYMSGYAGESDIQIGYCPGAINGLVALLTKDVTPNVQQQAAWALGRLCLQPTKIPIKIASCLGAIDGLVALLAKDVTPTVQYNAALALGRLSGAEAEIALRIAISTRAIDGLVALLAKDVTPGIQESAAWALARLSGAEAEIALYIVSCSSAVDGLVALLAKDVSPAVQKNGAWTLGQLCCKPTEIPIKIACAIDGLVGLLAKDVSPSVQENAAWALGQLCLKPIKVPNKISCAIDRLEALLAKDVSPAVQQKAIWALNQLRLKPIEISITIASCLSAIDGLVALLAEDLTPAAEDNAALVLNILYGAEAEIALQIASCPGAIDGLVALIAKDMSPAVQNQAAFALGRLCLKHTQTPIKIATCPGAIDGLVALLAKDVTPVVQDNATWALSRLSSAGAEIALQIASCPGAMDGLVALLVEDVTLAVREHAALALGYLSDAKVEIALQIASCPGAIDGLVALLRMDVRPAVLETAAWALGKLCHKPTEIPTKIASCLGAIDGLVALLAKDLTPPVQENAALALGRLSDAEPEIALQIVSCPGAIDGLVALLAKDVDPGVQQNVALAVGRLSGAEVEIALKIASCPGAIDGLVALLAKDVGPVIQHNAAWALGILSVAEAEIALQIASCPGAIEGLVRLLSEDVTVAAALALGRLSGADAKIALQIASCSGAIDGLVALLTKDVNPILHKNVAWALGILSGAEAEIAHQIASCPGAIDGLLALLAKDKTPVVQENAAFALGKICSDVDSRVKLASFPTHSKDLMHCSPKT